MPLTRGFTDEIKDLTAQAIIGAPKDELLETTLGRIGKHIDIPLRLYASATPDQYLNISASQVEAGDGSGKVTPPVDSTLPIIAAGQIGFIAKTAPAYVKIDGSAFTFPTTTVGQYRRLAFSVDGLGNLNAVWSTAQASIGALSDPGLLHVQMAGTPVGYLDLEALAAAGTYKTAGSTTSVIENKAGSDVRIFRYGSGSGSGSGSAGASLLEANFDETFIYYTRSDFSIEKKTFFSSTTGTESILGLKKIILGIGQNFISLNLLGPVFLADNPIINNVQVRLLYNVGKVDNTFTFTVTAANATAGAVYTNGSYNYTVLTTITGLTTLSCSGNGMMGTSGILTKVSGTGDTTITYSAIVGVTISVSADGGSNYTSAFNTYISGRFIVADFAMTAGTTSTDFRLKVVSNTALSELAGFGVNIVQDSTGAYAGDATFESRTISSTEASTGLITLTQVRFTPGAHQLHCNYSGHDFIAPDFIELGGGVVQFPTEFFTTGDVAKFYVGYGLVNVSNAPISLFQSYATSVSVAVNTNDRVLANTSAAALTLTLPIAPVIGAEVQIIDARGSFGTYAVTLERNGKLINGLASNFECDIPNKIYRAIFIDDTYGWGIYL